MIEYRSESAGEERPDDTTGELSAGHSLVSERVRLAGHSRSVRIVLQLGTALALVAAVVAAVLYGRHDSDGTATPPPTVPAVATSKPGPPSPLDQVAALAATHEFTTSIRQSSNNQPCPAVEPGTDPSAVVTAVVAAVVPQVVAVGTSRTIDQFTGLCALNVVLRDPVGNHLTITVSAPTATPSGTLDTQQVGSQTTTAGTVWYSRVGWHTGWSVLVGAVGDPDSLPSTTQLSTVANSPTLLW